MDCAHCDEEGCDQRCSRCGVAYYCGAACSIQDWRAHKAECFDRTQPGAIQSQIDALLDDIEIEDSEDKEFADLGENLIATLDCAEFAADPEIIGMSLQWLSIGPLLQSDKAKQASGLRTQARGLRRERRGTAKINIPKRAVLRAKEQRARGKAGMARQTERKRRRRKAKRKQKKGLK